MNHSANIIEITSLDLPGLQPYRTLRRSHEHMQKGIFVAEGEKVVRRLFESNLTIVSVLISREWLVRITEDYLLLQQRAIDFFIADKILLETIVGYNLHQGIMAVAKMPPERSLTETLGILRRPFLLVALDGLVNSENVGVVVRNCTAFGVDAVLVGETSSSPYLRRAVRNSMGTVFKLPVIHVRDLALALTTAHEEYQTEIVAAHPHEHNSINDWRLEGNTCVVFGNEGAGISEKVLGVCNSKIAIPMMNDTDSLNVASASAVFLHEISKQRTAQPT